MLASQRDKRTSQAQTISVPPQARLGVPTSCPPWYERDRKRERERERQKERERGREGRRKKKEERWSVRKREREES